jgi:hypothetical protein
MNAQLNYDGLVKKWGDVLNEESAGAISDPYKRKVTAALLENEHNSLREESGQVDLNEAAPATNTGSVARWDPVLISLVRRTAPNLMAFDVAGVQPMTGPTGLVFAMKSRYTAGTVGSPEALFNEANTKFSGTQVSGDSGGAGPSGFSGITDSNSDSSLNNDRVVDIFATGMSTDSAEALGDATDNAFPNMGFTIEKASVTAVSRALKADYSIELAQDLKAIHGLDAENELASILVTEVLAEQNRELIRTINSQAKTGCLQANTAINGVFNLATDADGRWSVEKFKGLVLQLEREANVIAKETRRGKGNFIICSSDVASALVAAGMLSYTPALQTNLTVDDTGNTFAGLINGRTKVYIDPYAVVDYINVGYRGTNPYDAGVFYCPYVPLTMMRAVREDSFQPRIGFKTRYGMISNPFVGNTPANGLAAARTNQYYRIFRVDGILA